MSREDLEQFLTDEGRAKVEAFVAEAMAEEAADREMQGAPCRENRFCIWASGCADCRPDMWRDLLPVSLRYGHRGSLDGASYEVARKSAKQIAAVLRQAADEVEAAHGEGFRLYEIDDRGVIRLVKGRAPRVY